MGWSGVKGIHISRSRGKRGLGKKRILKGSWFQTSEWTQAAGPLRILPAQPCAQQLPRWILLTCLTALLGYPSKGAALGQKSPL